VILTAGLTNAFANEDINQNAVASFQKDFVTASNVSWQQSRNYVKATFNLNNKVMYAFYNYRGELMAVIHHILSNELPGDLESAVKKEYREYWVSDLFELSSDEQHLYFMTLENADATIVLKSDGSSGWKFYKKLK
jgi:hypothetical protein